MKILRTTIETLQATLAARKVENLLPQSAPCSIRAEGRNEPAQSAESDAPRPDSLGAATEAGKLHKRSVAISGFRAMPKMRRRRKPIARAVAGWDLWLLGMKTGETRISRKLPTTDLAQLWISRKITNSFQSGMPTHATMSR